jgi:putative transposase
MARGCVHAELRLEHQIGVGRKRVERLMKAAGISGVVPRKRRRTTVRLPGLRVASDLVERDLRPSGPNLTWSADITYISTWEGFLYLAHVQDLFSRLIVGWSMADHLRSELVVDATTAASPLYSHGTYTHCCEDRLSPGSVLSVA